MPYNHLTPKERYVISHLKRGGGDVPDIFTFQRSIVLIPSPALSAQQKPSLSDAEGKEFLHMTNLIQSKKKLLRIPLGGMQKP